jgi:hypothetical protein
LTIWWSLAAVVGAVQFLVVLVVAVAVLADI